jgi:DNA-binding CsgD family transcriptional regulator
MNVGTIVALAEASTDRAAFERALLDEVMQHVGADVGAFRIGDTGAAITRGFSISVVGRDANPWERHAAELGPVLAVAARTGSAVDTAVLGERLVRSARYFSEVVRPHGGRETLYAIPSWRGRPAACLLLGRCGGRGRFGHADIGGLHVLLPAIALASAVLVKGDAQELRGDLSPRESEIVSLLIRGLRSREIGDALGTSVNTVRNQISRLMARLGVGTRAELVAALTRDDL